jgi:hypothetical protein
MRKISDERVGRQSHDRFDVNGEELTAAQRNALRVAQDYPVFPCDGVSKRPLTKHGFKEASREPSRVARWWRRYPEALIGVPTGSASGLVVIDVDPEGVDWYREHRERLGVHRTHQTRRGKHLLYRMNGQAIGNSAGVVAPGVDVRGEGGYIIWWAAHGAHPVGSPGELPGWLERKCASPTKPGAHRLNRDTEPSDSRDERRFRDGERNAALARRAYYYHRMGMSTQELGAALLKYDLEHCVPPYQETDGKHKVLYIARKKAHLKTDEGEKKPAGFNPDSFEGLTFEPLAKIQKKRLKAKTCWVGEWLYPGAWLVVGRPKVGKSWLLLQLLIQLGRGKRFLNFETRLGEDEKILAVFAEDDDARLKNRADEYGDMPASIHTLNRERFLELAQKHADQGDFPAFLDAYLTANPRYKIVVLDTEEVTRFVWKTKQLPEQRSSRLTVVDYEQTSKFDQIALRHGCAILLSNHASKNKAKVGESFDVHEIINRTNTALAGVSGSIVLGDLPDADRLDPNEHRRLFGVRGRDVEEDVLLILNRSGVRFINEGVYFQMQQTLAEQELLTELKEWIEEGDVGLGEFVSAHDLAKSMGKHHVSVRKSIAKMMKEGRTQWNGYRILTRKGRTGGIMLEKMNTFNAKRKLRRLT